MSFIYHIFGIIFYVIWSIIGALILVGLILIFVFKPWQAVAGGNFNLGAVGSLIGQAGGMGDLISQLQSGGGIKDSYNNLPKASQDCLRQEVGSQKVDDILAGKISPGSDVILKAAKCIK
jgi:hypothetical protein